MIDEDTYQPTESRGAMHKEDARLFVIDSDEREKALSCAKNWMLRAYVMQNNIYDRNTKNNVSIAEADTQEAIELANNSMVQTREEQIVLIEETFDDILRASVHPTKKGLKPLEIFEILPHETAIEPAEFTFCSFKDDPPVSEVSKTINGLAETYPDDESSTAAIAKSVFRSYGKQRHSLYLQAENQDDENMEHYLWLKEYSRQPTLPVVSFNNFFIMEHDGKMLYSRYSGRQNLRKRAQTFNDPNAVAEINSRPKAMSLNLDPDAEDEEEELEAEDLFSSANMQAVADEDATEADLFGDDSDDDTQKADKATEEDLFGVDSDDDNNAAPATANNAEAQKATENELFGADSDDDETPGASAEPQTNTEEPQTNTEEELFGADDNMDDTQKVAEEAQKATEEDLFGADSD